MADTLEPPACSSKSADLRNDTSAPALTRNDRAAGDTLAPHGISSASASGMMVLPHTSRHLCHLKETSPNIVASVRSRRSWTRTPSDKLQHNSWSNRSSARANACAKSLWPSLRQRLSDSRRSLPSTRTIWVKISQRYATASLCAAEFGVQCWFIGFSLLSVIANYC